MEMCVHKLYVCMCMHKRLIYLLDERAEIIFFGKKSYCNMIEKLLVKAASQLGLALSSRALTFLKYHYRFSKF